MSIMPPAAIVEVHMIVQRQTRIVPLAIDRYPVSACDLIDAGIDAIPPLIRNQVTGFDVIHPIKKGDGSHRESVKQWTFDRCPDDAIPDGYSYKELIDIIASLSGYDVYRWLVRHYSWTSERDGAWLYHALEALVLYGIEMNLASFS
jgi:hypothetical protein